MFERCIWKKKKSCKREPYGRSGTREYCCKWIQKNGVKRNEICHYKGAATYEKDLTKCRWKKLSPGKKQKVCCSWTRTTVNGHHKDTNKKCHHIGQIVEVSNKIGCTKRPFGANGLRKFCCSHKNVCVGKVCKLKKRSCSFRGPVYTEKVVKRCKWANKTKRQRQIKCCKSIINCKVHHHTKKRKCVIRGKKCAWKGRIIYSKRIRKCTFKTYGRKGIRNHCCSYVNVCKNGRCRHKNIRCKWEGCAKYQQLKYKCGFVHVAKNTIRKQCCTFRITSECKRKSLSKKKHADFMEKL